MIVRKEICKILQLLGEMIYNYGETSSFVRKNQIFDELQARKKSSNALDLVHTWYNLKKFVCDFKNSFLVLEISERQYLYA